jgi:hypothetical protein
MSQNNRIPFTDAIAMAARFRTNRESILDTQQQGKDILPLSETFDQEDIVQLMAQTGCTKFRVYLGMKEDLKVSLILVGVDANGADILPEQVYNGNPGSVQNTGELLEDGTRCPTMCPPASPLNED